MQATNIDIISVPLLSSQILFNALSALLNLLSCLSDLRQDDDDDELDLDRTSTERGRERERGEGRKRARGGE